jgi:hypothetical protein
MKYFYEYEIDNYIYYKIPKPLFTDEKYKDMLPLAKVLYGIFLDRNSLSKANGWIDDQGRVFFYFKVEDVCEMLNVSNKTATKLMKELEKYDLLWIYRQGLRKPNALYLGHFELSTS